MKSKRRVNTPLPDSCYHILEDSGLGQQAILLDLEDEVSVMDRAPPSSRLPSSLENSRAHLQQPDKLFGRKQLLWRPVPDRTVLGLL